MCQRCRVCSCHSSAQQEQRCTSALRCRHLAALSRLGWVRVRSQGFAMMADPVTARSCTAAAQVCYSSNACKCVQQASPEFSPYFFAA
jgi:hypothetical protein